MGVTGARCTFQVCRCWYPRHCLGLRWHGLCPCLLHRWQSQALFGGHINPTVTFGLFLARKLSLTRAVFYIVMQCLRKATVDAGITRAVEAQAMCSRRSVEGIVDDAKLSVLQNCAIGWVKEAIPIRVLAQELAVAGLQGFELVWIAGSMNIAGLWGSYLRVHAATEEPSSFERARVLLVTSFPDQIDEVVQVTVQDCVYTVVIHEAELVRIPIVEQWEEESELESGDESHGGSVASPECRVSSEQVRVVSPLWQVNRFWDSGRVGLGGSAVKQARSLDVVVGPVGACVALDCIGAGRGGVYSADDAGVAGAGDRSRVVVEAVQTSKFFDDRESPIGLLECGAATLNIADLLTTNVCALSSPPAVLGDVGAALAPVLGSVPGGIHKVKSVNCLVEALASPEQRRTVVAAHASRGRGRPTKTHVLIDAASEVVNASLTNSSHV
ncbi:hypothetical protein V6N12_010133 [Hibiscus sabdariffa]|uniref:Uncharacterized protein n=1 Tax=Hibiscus sabdariffa TaxID=183260 RepID=A0ABR2ECU7_9ROSI